MPAQNADEQAFLDGARVQAGQNGQGTQAPQTVTNTGQVVPQTPAPAPQQTVNPLLRGLGLYGTAALRGGASVLGFPGDVENLAGQGLDYLTGTDTASKLRSSGIGLPTTSQITNRLGLEYKNVPGGEPRTPGERYGTAAVEGGVAGLVPGLGERTLVTLPGALMKAGSLAGTGAAANVASTAVAQNYPGHPVLDIAAGLAAGTIPSSVLSTGEHIINRFTGQLNDNAKKFAVSGLPVRTQVLTTDDPKVAASLAPYGSEPLAATQMDAATKLRDHSWELGSAVDPKYSAQISGYELPQHLGETFRAEARDWMGSLKDRISQLYAPVNKAVEQTAPVLELPNTVQTLQNMESGLGTLKPVAQKLGTKTMDEASNTLSNILASARGGTVAPPNWGNLEVLKRSVGEKLDPIATKMSEKDQKALYASLSADQENFLAKNYPPEVLGAFQAAKPEASRLYTIRDSIIPDVISDVPGKESIPAATAGERFLSRTTTKKGGIDTALGIDQLASEFPNTVAAAGSLHANNMSQELLKPTGNVMRYWNKLSPEAKQAMFGDNAPVLESVADIGQRASTYGKMKAGNQLVATGKGFAGGLAADLLQRTALASGVGQSMGLPWWALPAIGASLPIANKFVKTVRATSPGLAGLAGARASNGLAIPIRNASAALGANAGANNQGQENPLLFSPSDLQVQRQ